MWPKLFLASVACAQRKANKTKWPFDPRTESCDTIATIAADHWGVLSAARARLGRGGLKKKIEARIETLRKIEATRKSAEEEEEGADELEFSTVDNQFAWFLGAGQAEETASGHDEHAHGDEHAGEEHAEGAEHADEHAGEHAEGAAKAEEHAEVEEHAAEEEKEHAEEKKEPAKAAKHDKKEHH